MELNNISRKVGKVRDIMIVKPVQGQAVETVGREALRALTTSCKLSLWNMLSSVVGSNLVGNRLVGLQRKSGPRGN